jgi:hypothetical protein
VPLSLVVDRRAQHIGRQQVAGELDAMKIQPQRARQRMRQRGLADPGHIFDQQMAARQQAGQAQANLSVFAEHDVVDLVEGARSPRRRKSVNFGFFQHAHAHPFLSHAFNSLTQRLHSSN